MPPTQYIVALVANPALTPSELLDEVLSQLFVDNCGDRTAGIVTARGGNSPIEPMNCIPYASGVFYRRGNDVIHRVEKRSCDTAGTRVYERSGNSDL